MNTVKRCLTAIVLSTAALSQAGCPAPQRQLDQKQELRNYETYNRFNTLYQQPAYMPNKR